MEEDKTRGGLASAVGVVSRGMPVMVGMGSAAVRPPGGHVSVGWGEGERSGEEWSEAGGFDAW